MSELSGFVYIKSHVILHVKSKAQKVNSLCWLETSALELSAVANLRHQRSYNTRVFRSCSLLLAGSKEVLIFNHFFCLISFLLPQETRQLIFPTLIKVWFLIIPQIISLFAE